jgi:hypothetical protein
MGNNNIGNTQAIYEKASQEMYRYGWLIFYGIIALVVGLGLVGAGIYYSQIAMAAVMGNAGINGSITWAVAIFVSAAEVFGLSLFFSGTSISDVIKEASRGEHAIGFWGTLGCFLYDFVTNVAGTYIVCLALNGQVGWQWIVIIPISLLFTFAEVFVGLAFRSIGLNVARFVPSIAKVKVLKERLEQTAIQEAKAVANSGQSSNRPNNFGGNQPKMDYVRFPDFEDRNLQPVPQRSANPYRGNGRNQPRG